MVSNKQIEEVLKSFPKLSYSEQNSEFIGELFITETDFYEVKVNILNFPREFPFVYEIGERIPQKADRHIYPNSGRCCLTTTAKEQVLLKTKIHTLKDFILLIVIPFFQNNSYYEIKRKYKEGEYSHGVLGLIEAYRDILQLDDLKNVPIVLEFLLSRNIQNNEPCFCGSDLPLKKCKGKHHLTAYKSFCLIDKPIVENDLYKLILPYFREFDIYQKFMRF